jgi:subtilisin family serine protease
VKLASINMSLGGGQYFSACDTEPLKQAIDNLRAAGVATAIAAGNNGFTNAVSYPGCISTAVTVGSSDKNDAISPRWSH